MQGQNWAQRADSLKSRYPFLRPRSSRTNRYQYSPLNAAHTYPTPDAHADARHAPPRRTPNIAPLVRAPASMDASNPKTGPPLPTLNRSQHSVPVLRVITSTVNQHPPAPTWRGRGHARRWRRVMLLQSRTVGWGGPCVYIERQHGGNTTIAAEQSRSFVRDNLPCRIQRNRRSFRPVHHLKFNLSPWLTSSIADVNY
jgi:hypothetical protein